MVTKAPVATDIFYPETAGMPLPEGETQAPQYRRAVGRLETYFKREIRRQRRARVNGNTMLYYEEGNNRVFVSPDCYVVFDLSEEAERSLSLEENNSYLLWVVGKPPEFALEIGSISTGDVDTGRKRDLYARIGVFEYFRHDPTGGDFYGEPLAGDRLVNGEYQPIPLRYENDGSVWAYSEALDLEIWWIDGELQFRDPVDDKWLLSHMEDAERADAAEIWADVERNRRIRAEARAEAEAARVAELEAELRRLRGG